MKHFIRTTGGKTFLFILCLLSILTLLVSSAAAVGILEMAYPDIYQKTEEEFIDENLTHRELYSRAHQVVWDYQSGWGASDYVSGIVYQLVDPETGEVLTEYNAGMTITNWDYTYTISEFLYRESSEDQDNSYAAYADSTVEEAVYSVEAEADPEEVEETSVEVSTETEEVEETSVEVSTETEEVEETSVEVSTETEEVEETSAEARVEVTTETKEYTVNLNVIQGSQLAKNLDFSRKVLHVVYVLRYMVVFIILGALLLAVLSYIALMCASARRPDSDELHPGYLNSIPFDILFVVSVSALLLGILAVADNSYSNIMLAYLPFAGLGVLGTVIFLGLSMSFAARLKQHNLIRTTLIYRICRLCWKILCFIGRIYKGIGSVIWEVLKNLHLIWKSLLGLGILAILGIIILESRSIFLLLLVGLVTVLFILYMAVLLQRLRKSGEALADGDLTYTTDLKGLFGDAKRHGEHLNSISAGMSLAVEKQLKSERMKTELITNVSHDIKTPLTSIINYADLISKEATENEKVTEYAEVLKRQSERLKRLLEDLVEASKASTGNLDVQLAPCDASVFLSQAEGEYQEKLEKAELELVTSQPEREVYIMADGRRMWRIFDNLMNNICKYAQSGTRVYLTLEKQGREAIITFKNISKSALNMTEEELMERFTRGDSSRNTEGSGLGLSIARSMAELQGGTMHLTIDGDLFKVTLTFPVIATD